jgi:hypothetical protein
MLDRVMDPQLLRQLMNGFALAVMSVCKMCEYREKKIFIPFSKCHYIV